MVTQTRSVYSKPLRFVPPYERSEIIEPTWSAVLLSVTEKVFPSQFVQRFPSTDSQSDAVSKMTSTLSFWEPIKMDPVHIVPSTEVSGFVAVD